MAIVAELMNYKEKVKIMAECFNCKKGTLEIEARCNDCNLILNESDLEEHGYLAAVKVDRKNLIELIKRDIKNIASIYPTAFDLYDEPLERLSMRIVSTVEKYNKEKNMNIWPGGKRHAMSQSNHEVWNSNHFPGTRQMCSGCDTPTGRCEGDSLYADDDGEIGPLCEECYDRMMQDT